MKRKNIYIVFDKLAYDEPIFCITNNKKQAQKIVETENKKDISKGFYYKKYDMLIKNNRGLKRKKTIKNILVYLYATLLILIMIMLFALYNNGNINIILLSIASLFFIIEVADIVEYLDNKKN